MTMRVPAKWFTIRDPEVVAPIIDHRQSRLTPMMQRENGPGTSWLTPILGWITIVVRLARPQSGLEYLSGHAAVALAHGVLVGHEGRAVAAEGP